MTPASVLCDAADEREREEKKRSRHEPRAPSISNKCLDRCSMCKASEWQMVSERPSNGFIRRRRLLLAIDTRFSCNFSLIRCRRLPASMGFNKNEPNFSSALFFFLINRAHYASPERQLMHHRFAGSSLIDFFGLCDGDKNFMLDESE